MCGVTGTSSVQSDCLWKELVSQSAGAGTADGNGESPWFGWLSLSLMVSDGPPCFPHTPPGVNVLEGQNHLGCCKSISNI